MSTPAISFSDLGLPEDLLGAVEALGFTTPTPIQVEAVPVLLSGRDIVGVAQTGTGKTAAFGLPLLAAIDPAERDVQAIVLAPTRELAIQVSDAVQSFAPDGARLDVLPVYGGSAYGPQLSGLKRGAQVVVGTPGRVMDLIDKRALDLSTVKFVVLDEADEMLRMGFAEDVETILAGTPSTKQVALFSATMPPAIRRVADTHLTDPVRISIAPQSTPIESVTQEYAIVPFSNKNEAVARIIQTADADAAIVFVRTREAAEEVGADLLRRGISAASISGDVPQRDREKIVDRLRAGQLDVLVATDVAARGLDVDRIGLVVNYDVPRETETYVHRIGRTGRAGRTGKAFTFLTPKEKHKLRQIERATGSTLTEAALPSRTDVLQHRANGALTLADERRVGGPLALHRAHVQAHVDANGTDPIDIAAALLALAVGDDGGIRASEDEALSMPDRGDRGERRERSFDRDRGERRERSFDRGDRAERGPRERANRSRVGDSDNRYRIAVGYRDGVTPQGIVGAMTNEGGLRGEIGKIDIFPTCSLVEIPLGLEPEIERRIGGASVAGRQLRIRRDTGAPSRGGSGGGKGYGERGDRGDRFARTERRPRYSR
ncbi:MAG: DEAD/DEAH box helicase [Salana multivorans]|nr:DEAD/DEAH box helicase [Salana multivorans]